MNRFQQMLHRATFATVAYIAGVSLPLRTGRTASHRPSTQASSLSR